MLYDNKKLALMQDNPSPNLSISTNTRTSSSRRSRRRRSTTSNQNKQVTQQPQSPNKNIEWYAVGKPIAGAVIRDILSDRVILERGGRQIEIELYPQRKDKDNISQRSNIKNQANSNSGWISRPSSVTQTIRSSQSPPPSQPLPPISPSNNSKSSPTRNKKREELGAEEKKILELIESWGK
ncbi:MAG: hypothetical protein V1872_13645 [bacterium]